MTINDDEIIGRIEDIVRYFKDELIRQINEIDMRDEYFESNGVENIQDNADNILELINGIYQDYITEKVNYDTPIRVYYHPMGAYQYEIL